MKILYVISFVLLAIGMVIVLKLTPKDLGEDVSTFLEKKKTIRELHKEYTGKKRFFLFTELENTRTILVQMGATKRFDICCYIAIIMLIIGIAVSYLLDNILFSIVLPLFLSIIPFVVVRVTVSAYEKRIREELETSLSIITTSYTRSLDIVNAIEENLAYLRPPIKDMFSSFLIEATMISSDIAVSLDNLKDKIDNEVFKEWCETVKACQNDKSLVDMLLPTVGKLTDIRIVNNDLKTILMGARREYFFMVLLVIMNFPIIYFMNKDWFEILVNSIPGKIVMGITLAAVLVTCVMVFKITKPIEYKR